jgi:hypothetical protein
MLYLERNSAGFRTSRQAGTVVGFHEDGDGGFMKTVQWSLETIPDRLRSAKNVAAGQFLAKPARLRSEVPYIAVTHPERNVVGVGIGLKIVKGKVTDRPCIRFYVERKVPAARIPRESLLPSRLEGIETDVVETGRFRALPATIGQVRSRLRPARPGCSVGFQFPPPNVGTVMAGTFGAVARAASRVYVLSNNHVLANENRLPKGSPIFQPGLLDGGDPARDQIAALSKFKRLQRSGPNKVDCAIAEVGDTRKVSAAVLPSVGKLASGQPISAVESMRVEKVGRTTAYTTGVVMDVSADLSVQYDIGVLGFTDQVIIVGSGGSFSDAGDSGSLIVDLKTKRPTALLFAGSASHTVANHIDGVLAALGVTIVA